MEKKLYTTYTSDNGITLYEIDKKTIKNKEYLLLLQREEPNLVVVGFLENGELQIIKNKVVSAQVFKSFMKNKEEFIKKFEPFVKFKEDKKG
jgi:hypothetical protein